MNSTAQAATRAGHESLAEAGALAVDGELLIFQ